MVMDYGRTTSQGWATCRFFWRARKVVHALQAACNAPSLISVLMFVGDGRQRASRERVSIRRSQRGL